MVENFVVALLIIIFGNFNYGVIAIFDDDLCPITLESVFLFAESDIEIPLWWNVYDIFNNAFYYTDKLINKINNHTFSVNSVGYVAYQN